MKILLTSDTYENQINGVSCSVITLRDELRKKGHDVRVLTLSSNGESKMDKTDYLIGSFTVPFYPSTRQTFKFNDPLIDNIISWKPDIIHIQTEFAISKIAKRIASECNAPYVCTSHTLWEDYTSYVVPSKKIGKLIARKVLRSTYSDAKAVVVPTLKIKDVLTRYGIDVPMHIIPTGIDLQRFKKKLSLIERSKLMMKYGLSSKNKILVSIGRVAKEKNIDELIDFLPDLIAEDKNIVLLIGGDGPHKKVLEEKVKQMKLEKHVIFTGMIPPKYTYKYFQLGDIFVCGSTSETQGITYIEAQACSLPLVCRYDRCLDNVIVNGENGYTYKTKGEFKKYIFKILNDKKLKNKMKKNAISSIDKFSKEKFGDDIEKLYLDVLNKKGCD